MYVPRGAYFLLEIDNIIHALGYGKHKKKSTQSFRQLVRKFHAFSKPTLFACTTNRGFP